jgi:MAP/microtubule affinity-regulating kinase
MSPEIVKKQSYAFGADVWACGVILFKLLTGVFPFRGTLVSSIPGNSEKDLFRKITIGKIEYPSFLSQGSRNLMGWMMRVD